MNTLHMNTVVNPGDGRGATVYLTKPDGTIVELRVTANTITTSYQGLVYRRVGDTREFRAAE